MLCTYLPVVNMLLAIGSLQSPSSLPASMDTGGVSDVTECTSMTSYHARTRRHNPLIRLGKCRF